MEHLTQKQIEDYSQRRLPAAELLAVTDHLGECESCRKLTGSGDATFFALHAETFAEAAEEHAHLTPDQTAEYVDKNLSGEALQMVTDHLATCGQCALAVDDLHAFRNEIAPSLEREYGPATAPSRSEGWWRRAFGSLPGPLRIFPAPAFGAALGVLLLALIGWLILRAQWEKTPKQEVVVLPSPSPSVQPAPAPSQPEPVALVAQLNDGARVLSLDQEGKLSGADDLPPAYQGLLKKALTTQRVEKSSQLQGLTRPPSSLMGADDQKAEFSVIEPAGNVLLTNRPTFRWSSMEGAAGYVVEVYDDQFKLVASSPQLTSQTWTAAQSLSRGKVYSWQVKATKDGQEITSPRPPAPQAKFRILDQAKANELAKAKRAYASSHLTLALLYADAGLLKEAEQELRVLRNANPNSDLARNLLRQVQALRR